jgi:hypothetical protein
MPIRRGTWRRSESARNREHELALAGDFTIYRRQARAAPDIASDLTELNLEPKGIPGFNLPLEANVVETGEERDLAPVFLQRKHGDSTDLGQRFDDQHARHYRVVRKMTLKKRITHGHILDANAAFASFELFDPIYQQERISVRDNLHDLDSIEGGR